MKTIGSNPDKTRQTQVVASGALTNGAAVVVNANGTVSVITGASASTGSEVVYQAGDAEYSASAYSSSDNKVVVFWKQGGNAIYGAVGTVSGTSISFGSPVLTNNYGEPVNVVYDSTNNKFVVAYRDSANNGDAFVATISGTSLSFGSTATFASSSSANHINPVFDSNAGKVVICYTDINNSSYGTAVVGTVSGTSISFGSPVVFNSANTFNSQRANAATFDSSNNKVVIAYQDVGNSNYGTAIIGTVSGTSISFGSESTWTTNSTNRVICSYDTDQNKVVIFYRDQTDANLNKAVIGTVSGTSISYGTPATVYDSVGSYGRSNRISYNAAAKKHLISFIDDTTGDSYFVELKVSGNSFTSTPAVVYATSSSSYGTISYDSGSEVNIIFFQDGDNSLYGTAFVKRLDSTNLTANNYIGTVASPVADTQRAKINLKGAVDENQSGLTAGQSYYVQTDGTLGTTPADPSVFAGTAVSATKLIVKG